MPVDRMHVIARKWRIEHVSTADDAGYRACVISGPDLTGEDAGIEVVPAEQLRGAVADWERASQLAEWIVRDRREPDKVLMYARELEGITERRAGGQ